MCSFPRLHRRPQVRGWKPVRSQPHNRARQPERARRRHQRGARPYGHTRRHHRRRTVQVRSAVRSPPPPVRQKYPCTARRVQGYFSDRTSTSARTNGSLPQPHWDHRDWRSALAPRRTCFVESGSAAARYAVASTRCAGLSLPTSSSVRTACAPYSGTAPTLLSISASSRVHVGAKATN